MEPYSPRIFAPVIGAFAGISSDVVDVAGVIATALATDHTQVFSISASEAKAKLPASGGERHELAENLPP